MINKVTNKSWIKTNQTLDKTQQAKTNQSKESKGKSNLSSDVVEIRTSPLPSVTYTKQAHKKAVTSEISELKQEADKATENLRTLVEKLILKQNKKMEYIARNEEYEFGTKLEEVKQANLALYEDIEFGVKAVSDRIVNFAMAISGVDKEMLPELRAAIEKGFAEARKVLGGELPDICEQTYKAVMDKLDQWNQEK